MSAPSVTISELEALMTSHEELDIEVMPDGSIRAVAKGSANNAKPDSKPLSWLASLAKHGEYY
jgi:hypothetical protein